VPVGPPSRAGSWRQPAPGHDGDAAGERRVGANGVELDRHPPSFLPARIPEAWLDWEDARKIPHFPTQVAWTRAKAIEEMDRNGIKTAVLSMPSTPGLWFDGGAEAASRMARGCNEYGADMMREYPGRFGLFATLSMLDIDATLKEIEHALDVLKADGIGLQTNYGDKWLGHPLYKRCWKSSIAARRGLCASAGRRLLRKPERGAFPSVIECRTTRRARSPTAAERQLPALSRHQMAVLACGRHRADAAGRINAFYGARPNLKEFAPDGIEAEFRRLYYDTANATSAPRSRR